MSDLEVLNEKSEEPCDYPDHLIELEGHIVGMGLSPDHRYLLFRIFIAQDYLFILMLIFDFVNVS